MGEFKMKLKQPLILRDAAREFGISYMWLRRQALNAGRVRWQKVGHYLCVEREDVEKLAAERQAVEQLLKARRKRSR